MNEGKHYRAFCIAAPAHGAAIQNAVYLTRKAIRQMLTGAGCRDRNSCDLGYPVSVGNKHPSRHRNPVFYKNRVSWTPGLLAFEPKQQKLGYLLLLEIIIAEQN